MTTGPAPSPPNPTKTQTEVAPAGHYGWMRFDLSRLGSREFEHLTQSIAVAELGPGVGVFGSGADGGREATFDGPTPIQTNGHTWDGYGVIQAKYKEFLGKPKDDATWLIGEVDDEMKGWAKRKKAKRKIPKYFIFATNVRLSAQDDGGIDRVNDSLQAHAKSLGFTGWLVWHSDTISTFVANHRDIRMAYASWVTPGDVLSEVLSIAEGTQRDFSEALTSYTAKELLRQRYVNLDQAGAADDRSVALADIFIDLPYQAWSRAGEGSQRPSTMTLAHLTGAADLGREDFRGNDHSVRVDSDRMNYVLVGGPGQGKTTITQFACQMYRASLVADTKSGKFGKVRQACEKIASLMKQEGISGPKNRRWPVNIQLTRLADDIAKGEATSLLDHIAKNITARTTTQVTAHQLRNWLSTYPWFVALDGLDEVPAASNRGEVLSLIDDFLVEASLVNADVFVVATTRPQGYTEEFSPTYYRHLQLTALTREVAMSYGRKLATARHGSESDRTDRLIERLDRATIESETSRLMTTPLQVTILAVLLERVGQAPKDRYNLFADYYQVIYQRELEKDSQASALLRDRQSDVDAIHAKVGFLLQTRSEHSGETHSTLSEDELGLIVRARLESEGHKGQSLTSLCRQVIKAATDRLVFLVSTRSNEIGFEIRSLQEFWAAQGIMQGTEQKIAEDLRRIAPSAHWRNTLLFAVGHIFSKRETLRDTTVSLVAGLNSHSIEHGEINKAVLTGSRLAVAILSDGMVRSPNYLESLTDQALKLFELPPDADVRMIASCLPKEMLDALFSLVERYLKGQIKADELSLVYALSSLALRSDLPGDSKVAAMRFATSIYNLLPDQSKLDALSFAYNPGNKNLRNLTINSLVEAPLHRVVAATVDHRRPKVARGASINPGRYSIPEWARAFRGAIRPRDTQQPIRSREETIGFDGELRSLKESQVIWQRLARTSPPKRTLLHDCADFGANPGSESLVAFLKSAVGRTEDLLAISESLPWVVKQLLTEEPDPAKAAQAVESGLFGDLSDWEALEVTWDGTLNWPTMLGSMRGFISRGEMFYPLTSARGVFRLPNPDSLALPAIKSIFHDYDQLEFDSAGTRPGFASWLLTLLFVAAHENRNFVVEVGPDSVRRVLEDASRGKHIPTGWLDSIPPSHIPLWMECLDFMGRQPRSSFHAFSAAHTRELISIWEKRPDLWGLARIASLSRDDVLSSLREKHHWNKSPGFDNGATEDASNMSVLFRSVLGVPPSKSEALAISNEVLKQLRSDFSPFTLDAIGKMHPGRSHSSRVLYLKCAEGLSEHRTLQVQLYERLVEALGQDASGIGEP